MYNTGEQPKYTERKSNKNSFPLLPKLTVADLHAGSNLIFIVTYYIL